MYNTFKDIKHLKSKGWANHNAVGSKNFKSVYHILHHYKHQADFDAIAERCSKNPTHEMFGKDVEVIKSEWKQRGEVGKQRGRWLDSYIQNKLHKTPFTELSQAMEDDVMVDKFKHFDNLREQVLIKAQMRPIASEIWVNSGEFKVRGKFDELFYIDGGYNGYVLVDWKNTEDIKESSQDKMSGCLSHLPSCDLYEYFLQLYIYMFLLREEYGLNCKGGRIMQIAKEGYDVIAPPKDFPYDAKLIRQVLIEYNQNKID